MKPFRLSNGKHGGWRPDKPKYGKDWHIDQLLGAPRRGALKSAFLTPLYYPKMKNQGSLGSCTGESLAYALEYCTIRNKAEEGDDVTSPWWKKWALSGLAAYYFTRVKQRTVYEDSGGEIRTAIDAAREFGIPVEELWPYVVSRFKVKPDAKAMKTAPWHKPDNLKTYRCDGSGGSREETVTNIARALAAGLPINFGFACPEDWQSYDETGMIPLPGNRFDGGHAMTGFQIDAPSRVLIGPNTWGDTTAAAQPRTSRVASRGGKGWFILPLQYFLDGNADDAWAVDLR
jgi:hypothetical protein